MNITLLNLMKLSLYNARFTITTWAIFYLNISLFINKTNSKKNKEFEVDSSFLNKHFYNKLTFMFATKLLSNNKFGYECSVQLRLPNLKNVFTSSLWKKV